MIANQRNWAGNYTYTAERWHHPQTVSEVQEIVARSHNLKVVGTRHSFNAIADSAQDLMSLQQMDRILALDRDRQTVTVEAGIRYGELCQYLQKEGFALHNLASLPHISVAGACATATHGSGVRNGNLATAVSALEIVTANGELITLSRLQDEAQFRGVVVALGGLGVVTKLTLDIVPSYDVRQYVYENLSISSLELHFEEIVSAAYSVSLFTNWRTITQVWIKQVVDDNGSPQPDPNLFGATLAQQPQHPIAGLSAEPCTEQMGVPGPWHERLPHFRLEFKPSHGEELQSEYYIPRQHAFAAIQAVSNLGQQLAPQLLVSEIRTIAADDLWLSPCYQQDCISIHFTWRLDWPAVRQLLPLIEEQLRMFNGRPHWGKLFAMSPGRIQQLYKRLPQFQQLLQQYDPGGKFRNDFLNKYIL